MDLTAAQQKGVPVFNAPFSSVNTRSVADIGAGGNDSPDVRGIPWRNAQAHRGGWAKTAAGSHEVRGKCLGIVGYGHIGTQVGLLAESLGMRVIFHDVETQLALGNATQAASLEGPCWSKPMRDASCAGDAAHAEHDGDGTDCPHEGGGKTD